MFGDAVIADSCKGKSKYQFLKKKSKHKYQVDNKGNIILHSDSRKKRKQKGNLQFGERFWKLLWKK